MIKNFLINNQSIDRLQKNVNFVLSLIPEEDFIDIKYNIIMPDRHEISGTINIYNAFTQDLHEGDELMEKPDVLFVRDDAEISFKGNSNVKGLETYIASIIYKSKEDQEYILVKPSGDRYKEMFTNMCDKIPGLYLDETVSGYDGINNVNDENLTTFYFVFQDSIYS